MNHPDDLDRLVGQLNGQRGAAPPPTPVPLPGSITMINSRIDGAEGNVPGVIATQKAIVATHASGFQVVIPMDRESAQIIGAFLLDRPVIVVPPGHAIDDGLEHPEPDTGDLAGGEVPS